MRLNQTQTADLYGVSPRRIRTLESEGWFSRDNDGLYDSNDVGETFAAMDPSRRTARAVTPKLHPKPTHQSHSFIWIPAVEYGNFPSHIELSLADSLSSPAYALSMLNKISAHVRINGLAGDIKAIEERTFGLLESWYIHEGQEEREYWDYHLDSIRKETRQSFAVLRGREQDVLEYAGSQYGSLFDAFPAMTSRSEHVFNLQFLVKAGQAHAAVSLILNRLAYLLESSLLHMVCDDVTDEVYPNLIEQIFEVSGQIRSFSLSLRN